MIELGWILYFSLVSAEHVLCLGLGTEPSWLELAGFWLQQRRTEISTGLPKNTNKKKCLCCAKKG